MVIKKGKLTNRFKLQVQEEVIPSIEDNPIKCLVKWFDDSLTDRNSVTSIEKQAEEWHEKSELPEKFKTWLYQHGLLSRLMWLLKAVEGVERKINKYL